MSDTPPGLEEIPPGLVEVSDDPEALSLIAEEGQQISSGKKALGGIAKALDYARGGLTAPMLAAALEKATGKDVYRKEEQLAALNPTSLDTFPSSEVLYERAGVPVGASASDVAPGLYSETGDEWLKFKKGGFLDPTVRGAAGVGTDMAIDPLTYLTAGGSVPAKAGARTLAERIGSGLKAFAKAPSEAIASTGRGLYRSAFLPMEQLGERYGKKEVAETAYKHGVYGSARAMEEKALKAAGRLTDARDAKLAAAAGQDVSMHEATREAQDLVNTMIRSEDPQLQKIAAQMQAKIDEYTKLSARPAMEVPGQVVTREVPVTPKADDYGSWDWPTTETVTEELPGYTIPGRPGVSPETASGYKTSLYKGMGSKEFDEAAATDAGGEVVKALAKGLKSSTEKAVGKALGPAEEAALIQMNHEIGQLITPKRAFRAAKEKAERTPMVTQVDMLGLASGNPAIQGAIAAKMALRTGRMTGPRSTLGYGLRKFAENPWAATTLNTALRRGTIEENALPWSVFKEAEDEEARK